MAVLVPIHTPRSFNEKESQERLREMLPDEWIITTNIKEHVFVGKRRPELDCVVLCPLGLFILDFKHVHGRIVPMAAQPWVGLDSNPFDQLNDNNYPLKNLLKRRANIDVWIDGLVVLTNKSAWIDWNGSDVQRPVRAQVTPLDGVELSIRAIRANEPHRVPLDAAVAQRVLEMLGTQHVPIDLFRSETWLHASKSTSSGESQRDNSNGNAAIQSLQDELAVEKAVSAFSRYFDWSREVRKGNTGYALFEALKELGRDPAENLVTMLLQRISDLKSRPGGVKAPPMVQLRAMLREGPRSEVADRVAREPGRFNSEAAIRGYFDEIAKRAGVAPVRKDWSKYR